MISKQDHAHERDPNQIGRCKHCSMWQCFNGRWHEAGTTCITAECKQELELASKEIKPHLTAEEIAKRHGFIPRSYSPSQFEKCVAAIKEFLSQVPETLYCDVCESELQRESCNHVRPCPNCALKQSEVSQPAGAREWRNKEHPSSLKYNDTDGQGWWDDERVDTYVAQQTAAKDTALNDEIAVRDAMVEQLESLYPQLLVNGNALDFTKSVVKAAERERDSLREALKEALLYDINMDLRITIEATLKAGKDGQQ